MIEGEAQKPKATRCVIDVSVLYKQQGTGLGKTLIHKLSIS